MTASSPRVLATIDIGTNSVLMQIAKAGARGQVEVQSDRATITRLGRGVDRSHRLDDAAVARTLAVLGDYAATARERQAEIFAVATSAVRDARNAAEFLEPAARILGTQVVVINGSREAELTYLGATQGLSLEGEALCVVDVGGGSTEIVCGERGQILAADSLDVGAVRLCERHALLAPALAEQLDAIRDDVQQALAGARVRPTVPLVAIAGTATTLAAIRGAVDPYDPARIHGARLPTPEIAALLRSLAAMSLEQRHELPGLDRARADVIVSGAAILLAVAEAAQADEVVVSNGGVRMGLAAHLLAGGRWP